MQPGLVYGGDCVAIAPAACVDTCDARTDIEKNIAEIACRLDLPQMITSKISQYYYCVKKVKFFYKCETNKLLCYATLFTIYDNDWFRPVEAVIPCFNDVYIKCLESLTSNLIKHGMSHLVFSEPQQPLCNYLSRLCGFKNSDQILHVFTMSNDMYNTGSMGYRFAIACSIIRAKMGVVHDKAIVAYICEKCDVNINTVTRYLKRK